MKSGWWFHLTVGWIFIKILWCAYYLPGTLVDANMPWPVILFLRSTTSIWWVRGGPYTNTMKDMIGKKQTNCVCPTQTEKNMEVICIYIWQKGQYKLSVLKIQRCEIGSQRDSNETELIKRRSRRKPNFVINYKSKHFEKSGICPT